MFKHILAAVDGSGTSTRALRAALALAGEQRSRLTIVHVVDTVPVIVDSPYDPTDYQAAARKAGEQVLRRAAAMAQKAGVPATPRLLELQQVADRAADGIVDAARQARADLIVIGTHGRRGVSHLLLGSVAESVVRIASMPVLLIRGKPERRARRGS
ncbi:MAG TPA: universal stress protein [Burkholderiaceae bacterium]|jgi:nucleotide-binding universal stress UspA family protein|nr:universal stress protein [Burkholderiaceae bacterium]